MDELLGEFEDNENDQKKKKYSNPFKKLEDRFDIPKGQTVLPNKKEQKEIKQEIKEGILNTKELIQDEEFEDKEYIRENLKSTIERLKAQLDTIEESTLIGAEPRVFETYSVMAKTLLDAISKLADLQKQVSATINNNAILNAPSQNKVVMEEKVVRKISSSSFNDLLDECRK